MKSYKRYKTLSANLIEAIGFIQTTPQISCIDSLGEEHNIEILDCEKENFWKLRSEDGYYLDDCSLTLKMGGNFQDSRKLFSETGLAPHNAILGVATKWISKDACMQGIIQWNSSINVSTSEDDYLSMTHTFAPGTLRGTLELETFLFMKENPCSSKIFATDPGANLGVLEKVTFLLDGNGSIFPVEIINKPYEPLWKVSIETEEIDVEKFSDSVTLILNEAHPGFVSLNINGNGRNSTAFNEIMASAILLIIQSCLARYDYKELLDMENNRSEEYPGSIANAVLHFFRICELNIDMTISEMHIAIHKYFDKAFPVANEADISAEEK